MDELVTVGLIEKLKNIDFIVESKTVKINKNQNYKQPDWPDAV